MKYVALLRGVNVGGKHRVPQADFKKVLESLGFYNVAIYLNSGNAVFSSDVVVDTLQVQTALESFFGFSIPTLILRADKLQMIAGSIPDDWSNDSANPEKRGQKSDVVYLFDEVNNADILHEIGYNPEIETMHYVDGAVIANIARTHQAKGSLQKIMGTPLYAKLTVRNVNTARKLAELCNE